MDLKEVEPRIRKVSSSSDFEQLDARKKLATRCQGDGSFDNI